MYIGETNDLPRRLKQHSHDLTKNEQNSALTAHRSSEGHRIGTSSASSLKYINHITKRKIVESLYIYNTNNFNRIPGEVKLDSTQMSILLSSRYLADVKEQMN